MKTIITQFRVASRLNVKDKREFVIKKITEKLFNLRDKEAFLENTASKLREVAPCNDMDNTLNGILGYAISLMEENRFNIWENWIYESMHDIAMFVKFHNNESIKLVYRTRMYKSYVKELKMERV